MTNLTALAGRLARISSDFAEPDPCLSQAESVLRTLAAADEKMPVVGYADKVEIRNMQIGAEPSMSLAPVSESDEPLVRQSDTQAAVLAAYEAGKAAAVAEHKAEIERLRKDAERYRWLCANNFDRDGRTQIHTWVHSWEPHSQTGEPINWLQRVRGGNLDQFIDAAIKGEPDDHEG